MRILIELDDDTVVELDRVARQKKNVTDSVDPPGRGIFTGRTAAT